MKRKFVLILAVAAAMLMLSACRQTAILAQQLDEYAELIESTVGAIPTVTPAPSATPKPSYIPKITPKPSATPMPSPSLYPMPTFTPKPSVSPSPAVSPTPTPTATPATTAAPTATPTVVLPTVGPLPTYAPIPKSVPFQIATATPAPTAEPTAAPVEESAATPAPTEAPAATRAPSATAATGQEVADFALKYVGYSYLYGGESPEEGFDCSGLVYYVYGQFGYSLNRTAAAQADNGVSVEHSALEPGDVLCFYNNGRYIGHSGIYIGGGEYVHAQGAAYGVVVSPLSERGDNYEARRILS